MESMPSGSFQLQLILLTNQNPLYLTELNYSVLNRMDQSADYNQMKALIWSRYDS